ncbi:MAG: glycine cleavage system protein GcvH [Candidatus Neomarinimicrobiota bacterium]|tara:strand:- start:303 stop:680 length:378 start_codon:yes stop_codon:yes gene_type:complete
MNTPENLLYTTEHEWVSYKSSDVIIGITDYAQSQLGDIIFVELPEVGAYFKSGEVFGEIEAVKTVSELYAPISGKVLSINEELESSPEKVNLSPYSDGWLIKISPENPKEKESLLTNVSYQKSIE